MQDPNYLIDALPLLDLPAEAESSALKTFYDLYKDKQKQYLLYRADRYSKHKDIIFGPQTVWDGDQTDHNATLTVFRHFDNASVIKGLWGGQPKTVWLMDYPIFERMYYLLVAGFNVFGNVFHQGSTRLFMDNLRIESEDNFLYLLPFEYRQGIRDYWYQGKEAREKMQNENALYNFPYKTNFRLPKAVVQDKKPPTPDEIIKRLLNELLAEHIPQARNQSDPYHCCLLNHKPSDNDEFSRLARRLTARKSSFARHFPELTIMEIRSDQQSQIFFLSKVTAHKNVSFLFNEKSRLLPEEDRLILNDDWVGSYPNYFLTMTKKQFASFVSQLETAKSKESVAQILVTYGLPRNDPGFWSFYDHLETLLSERYREEYGRLDISRYINLYHSRKPKHSD